MNGGPATIYGARAFAAFQEFYGERAAQPNGQLPITDATSALHRQRGRAVGEQRD